MITTTVSQLAYDDFERAMYKAWWRDWISWLTRKCNDLLSFDQIRADLPSNGQHMIGLQVVPLDKIVGSEGRIHDFDRAFFPRKIHTRERWVSIAKAFYAEVPLPPVDLFNIGERYFVVDGHHRVSVARARGQNFMDAHVTEVGTPMRGEGSKKEQR